MHPAKQPTGGFEMNSMEILKAISDIENNPRNTVGGRVAFFSGLRVPLPGNAPNPLRLRRNENGNDQINFAGNMP